MKKNKALLVSLPFLLLLCTSCKKKASDPVARFTMDKDTYAAGDNIATNNTSQNANDFLWDFINPDGGIISTTATYPPAKLNVFTTDGVYTLTLKATNADGKTASYSKTFVVKTTRAKVLVYGRQPSKGVSYFYADDELIGYLYMAPTSNVAVISSTVPIGPRTFQYSLYQFSSKKSIDVKEGQPNEVHFDY